MNNNLLTYNQDYTVNNVLVQFFVTPPVNSTIEIRRRSSVQLDYYTYYNVAQNSTSGSGVGATFTVNNTRGMYSVRLTAPGVNYAVNDTLTISYTQVDPTGSSANNIVITVTSVTDGGITGFTFTGSAVTNTSVFSLTTYLYTATTYDSFTVIVNGVLQRPYIDYTFSGGTLTFITNPAAGATIAVQSATVGAYWEFTDTITSDLPVDDAQFGKSIVTNTDGTQLLIGAPYDTSVNAAGDNIVDAGAAYAYSRSVYCYVITSSSQLTYAIPGSISNPLSVTLNGQFLTNSAQYINGQYTVSGSNIVLSNTVPLTIGDTLEIQTNQFQFVERFTSNNVIDESEFGQNIDVCPNSCSVYVGAPLDTFASGVAQAGMVQRQVNQSRIYGITSSTVSNPTLNAGDTIRINNVEVAVPASPNNTVAGLVSAINLAGISNVMASNATNVALIGDGVTQTFSIGNIYSSASSYTTVVYVNNVLLTAGVDYTYNNSTQQISFVTAPALGNAILVVAGRMTINVINAAAADEFNKLTVLPGSTGTAFATLGFNTYAYTQTIISPAPTIFAYFGSSISVNTGAVNLVIGAPNGNVYEPTTFDEGLTYFDEHSTTFFGYVNNSGVAFSYDYLPSANDSIANPGQFIFGQQIYSAASATTDQFGTSVDYRNGRLLVGAPGSGEFGAVSVLNNDNDLPAWEVLYSQQPMVDVNLLTSVYSYDKLLNSTQTYFDYIDPLQGKILGAARQNIDFIGAVDPASYNNGSVHNIGTSWGPGHVGEIWWDTNSVRFIDANQDNITYASRRWGQVFPGSSIDIYQWVASSVPPVSYTGPGTPFSLTSYTVYSTISNQGLLVTTYYFWVTGINTVATAQGKTLSTTAIANYILNPSNSGLPYIAALSANSFAIYNANSLLSASDTIIHIEYDRQAQGGENDIHTEYAFIADGKASSFLNANLYRKFLDSFCGVATTGAAVPDPTLSLGMQFGVEYRPRQSMFADRFKALENYLTYANNILAQYPISETRSFNLLNSSQPTPAANSGAWDFKVPNLEILSYQDLALVPVGYKYLVLSDSIQNGRWTIYQVVTNGITKSLFLVQVQNYDTPLYWSYIDWYLPGYNSSVQPIATVSNIAGLQTLSLTQAPLGSSVKVSNNGENQFEIYLRVASLGTLSDWERVGLENGTIAFDSGLWDYTQGGYGFDTAVFDSTYFDQDPSTETRYIIRAINEELFVDDLLINRNQSLILMFQYIYSEFTSPSWLFKSSYIDVDHVVRGLLPYPLYQPDNQTFVEDYLTEVKPYHVQFLSFNLIYNGQDTFPGELTDYDVPSYWNTNLEIPQFVSPVLLPYTYSDSVIQSFASDTPSNAQIWTEQPWTNWFNNYTLSVESINVVDTTTSYTTVPSVDIGFEWQAETTYTVGTQIGYRQNLYTVIVSGTTGVDAPTFTLGTNVSGSATLAYTGPRAQAEAILNSNGTLYSIVVTVNGYGFLTTPPVAINGVYPDFVTRGAQVVPVMGNNLVRSFKTTVKYDRYQYATTIYEWQPNVVYITDAQVRWNDRVWASNSTQSSSTFIIENWTLVDIDTLSGVDRTMGFYVPGPNMPGLSLPLLIDGVDYPGVQVSAPGFNQNTGYDVGNYDINSFDNYAVDAEGRPTYDPSILDAQYSSSYTDLYLGSRATDINVDGGGYVDVFSSHAPEELVPGIEFDTLDMRVYTRPGADWLNRGHGFPSVEIKYTVDLSNLNLSFAGLLPYPALVLVSSQTQEHDLHPGSDYTVDYVNQFVTLIPNGNVQVGDVVVITVYEIGGGNQIYKNMYNGAAIVNTITVPVAYYQIDGVTPQIQEFVIFVNGTVTNNYTYAPDEQMNTTVTFGTNYTVTDNITLYVLAPTQITTDGPIINYSWSAPQTQYITGQTSVLTYDLDNSLEYVNPNSLVVTVNGIRARTAGGVRYTSDGSTTVYALPGRLGFDPSTIIDNQVNVYVNDIPLTLYVDFTLTSPNITLTTAPADGDEILIYVTTNTQCYVNGSSQLVFNPYGGFVPTNGSIIAVTTWNDTRQQHILSQCFVGPVTTGVLAVEPYDSTDYDSGVVPDSTGSYDYSAGDIVISNDLDLGVVITNPARLWVSLNGRRLFNNVGFTVSGTEVVLTSGLLGLSDVVMISQFTNFTVPESLEFRIFQDMRGVQAVYRMTPDTTTTTTQPVLITDDTIHVVNANALIEPNFENNIWGVVTIDAERIMYRQRDIEANTIGGLMRGTAGTAVAPHNTGAIVYNMGRGNLLDAAYQDYIVSDSSLGDGTTVTFTAEDIDLTNESDTLQYDALEVYVGGVAQAEHFIGDGTTTQFALTGAVDLVTPIVTINGTKQLSGYTITTTPTTVTLTFESAPAAASVIVISTYTLNAVDPVNITFVTAPPAGVEITMQVRRGVTWYAQGVDTASNGNPLQITETPAARFLQGL
jgi:hypothetical protein